MKRSLSRPRPGIVLSLPSTSYLDPSPCSRTPACAPKRWTARGCREHETIGERIATAMAHKRTKSERVGAVPYGHGLATDGRHALTDRGRAGGERRGAAAEGLLPLRIIAAELARAGMVTRSGKRFAAAQVQRMVAA
jgi:hypothetical protein